MKRNFIFTIAPVIILILTACTPSKVIEVTRDVMVTPTFTVIPNITSTNTIKPTPTPTPTPTPLIVDGLPDDWVQYDYKEIIDQEFDLVNLQGVADPQSPRWIDIKSVRVLIQDNFLYILIELFGNIRPNDPNTGIIGYSVYLTDVPNHKANKVIGLMYVIKNGIEYYFYDGKISILDNNNIQAAYMNNYVELALPLNDIQAKIPNPVFFSYGSSRNIGYDDSITDGPKVTQYRIGDWDPTSYTLILPWND
jgi:hypothetical protein